MKKITTVPELRAAIQTLETKQAHEEALFREQFKVTCESIRPVNLIKGVFSDLVKAPDVKSGLLDSILGISLGSISKKILVGSTMNPMKFLVGAALQMIITTVATKNAGGIKAVAAQLIKKISKKKSAA